ncbi:DUF5330 domain-containing protein [Aureimonas sp. AU40]|uniref:DUF5330 domain-containing protein n=1 Tax=Aureimonas sp. AU40 TaxID=1637747 RepID=UPI000784277A|nr:DUF5330 domain-containing protein [Aureimonas sp. AU40]
MRFLIKIAFLIGLVALFLPGRSDKEEGHEPGLSPVVLLYGVQQAFSDLGSFCERSPAACATARDAASFVAQRVTEGAAIGYGLIREKVAGLPPEPPADARPAPKAYTPPGAARPAGARPAGEMTTGAVAPNGAPMLATTKAPGSAQAPRALAFAPAERVPSAGFAPRPAPATALHAPQPYRQPVPAKTASEPARTASALPAELDHVPGSPKPFRMPAMAGGARDAAHPLPQAIVPPERAPVPRFAPRA